MHLMFFVFLFLFFVLSDKFAGNNRGFVCEFILDPLSYHKASITKEDASMIVVL